MTKLEFLDKINDILVGLNTLESDLLGSLYDELMSSQWRSVEEELPKQDGRYWCCDDDDGQEELKWRDGHWYGLLDPYPVEGVTHWMPFPQPPKKGVEK